VTRYQVVIDPRAEEDIEQALNWLKEQAPHKVEEWFDSLESEILSLQTIPERCPLAPENGRWEPELEIRQLLFDRYPSTYRILFTILGKTVRILQIRHGARRYLFESDQED
jgi:plasmid stabilization system protein ParE